MKKGYFYSDLEVLEEANLLAYTPGASTYTVAHQLGRPQATVWWHVTHRLPGLDVELSAKVQVVLRNNNKRGG
nr:MAG TPA: stage III sporulation protein D [Caudoviricetes sp.]